MGRITVKEAAAGQRLSEQDIREAAEKYDLACKRDDKRVIVEVNKEALERVLVASGVHQGKKLVPEFVEDFAHVLKQKLDDNLTRGLTAIAAFAGAGAAFVALNQMWDARDAAYAQNRYIALSDVTDAKEKVLEVDQAFVESAVSLLDSRIGIVHQLRKEGGLRDDAWIDFLRDNCKTIADANYFGHERLLGDTKAMCEEEKERWMDQGQSAQ